MFWYMSSKLIKGKCLYYILSIFVWFCCFQIFQENYTYAVDNLDSYHISDPLDQANLICFWGISSKLMKEKYLKYIFCIFSFTRKISSTFIKESSKLIKENTCPICWAYLCAFVTFCFFQENYLYIWSEYFLVTIHFWPLGSGQFDMFWRYLIKVNEGEILRQYFKHICLLLLFIVFLGKCHWHL